MVSNHVFSKNLGFSFVRKINGFKTYFSKKMFGKSMVSKPNLFFWKYILKPLIFRAKIFGGHESGRDSLTTRHMNVLFCFHANFRLTVVRSMNLLYMIWEGDRSIIPKFTKSLCLYEYSELWRMQALRNQLKNDSYINFDE